MVGSWPAIETIVTLEVLKLVSLFCIVFELPKPTLPKSIVGLPNTTVSLI